MKKQIRRTNIKRKTSETDIAVSLLIDGKGKSDINTGIGFLDHMLVLLAKHGLFDLKIKAKGDLEVDIHHTNEDVGICLGQAFSKALGAKKGIKRFSTAYVPMDEALVRTVLDISGRPRLDIYIYDAYLEKKSAGSRKKTEGYTLNDAKQFLQGFVLNSGINMNIGLLEGEDLHHVLEAMFKSLALALKEAVTRDKRVSGVPSTKGRL